MEELIQDVFSGLPRTKASARLQNNFRALLQSVPLASGYIFEQADQQMFCDISLRLSRTDGTLNHFLKCIDSDPAYKYLQSSDVWGRLVTFLSGSSDYFQECWLEFDDADLQTEIPIPSIFVNPETLSDFRLIKELECLANSNLNWSLVRELLETADSGKLHFIGLMLSRGVESVRLCLKLPGKEIGRLNQAYSLGIKREELADRREWSDDLVLSLDVGEKIKPRVGIEYPVTDALHAQALHEVLSEKDWVASDWPGNSCHLSDVLAHHSVSSIPLSDQPWVYSRRINHFKQVFWPDRKPELKTYSYLGLGWYQR